MSKRRSKGDDELGFRTPTKRRSRSSSESKDKRSREKRTSRERDPERERDRRSKTGRTKRRKTGEHERPTKRKTGEHERPTKRKTGKHERVKTGKHERVKTGEHERPKKRKTGKHSAVGDRVDAAPAAEAGSGKSQERAKERAIPTLPLLAGLAGAVIVGGLAVMLLMGDPPKKKQPQRVAQITPAPQPSRAQPSVATPVQPAPRPQPSYAPRPKPSQRKVAPPPKATPKPKVESKTLSLEELAKKSATHGAIASVIEEHMALFDPGALRAPGPNFQPFHERRQREEELLARLRAMGPLAVEALQDMLVGLGNRHQRIFLGKALAGIEGPEAREAVGQILGEVKDMSIQLSLTRSLPASQESADLLAGAFSAEGDANLRSMLMREYNRRLAPEDAGELFRDAAKDDDPRVRAEAISILGRRGREEDFGLLEDVVHNEQDVNIRKRAIQSYAQTGKGRSLPVLESLVNDPQNSLGVRASAVLGISLVGGEQAILVLDQVGTTDPDPQIRQRATVAANNLRRNMQRDKTQQRVDAPPVRIGPSGEPLERR